MIFVGTVESELNFESPKIVQMNEVFQHRRFEKLARARIVTSSVF